MNTLLEQIITDCRPDIALGHVATYIPELANMDPDKIGVCLCLEDGKEYCAGDWQTPFTMQSVVKPLILLRALMDSVSVYEEPEIGSGVRMTKRVK